MAEVAVRVLGGVRLQGPHGATSVGGRNAERLLGALVAAGGRATSIDELAEAVWPTDAPSSSVAPLRMAVSRLRRRLVEAGVPDAVSAEPGGYRLTVPSEQVDVERFRLLVADARALAAAEPDRAAAHFDAALALWRGEPFGRLASEPWAIIPVANWNDLHLDVEEEAAELELARHRQATVISRLQLAVERQPLRERRWAQLAIALFRLGRQAEALRAVARARELLREELGADLGEDLRRVELGLLTHDPTLLTVGEQQSHPAPLARLVGRGAEVAEVLELLETNRVVTLHGLGGVGKSAVARHLARRQQDRGHNVVTARLDGLAGSDEVCLSVAAALGLPGGGDTGRPRGRGRRPRRRGGHHPRARRRGGGRSRGRRARRCPGGDRPRPHGARHVPRADRRGRRGAGAARTARARHRGRPGAGGGAVHRSIRALGRAAVGRGARHGDPDLRAGRRAPARPRARGGRRPRGRPDTGVRPHRRSRGRRAGLGRRVGAGCAARGQPHPARGGVAAPRRPRARLVRPARRDDVRRGPPADEPAPPEPAAGHVGTGSGGGPLPAAGAGPRDRRGAVCTTTCDGPGPTSRSAGCGRSRGRWGVSKG